MSKDWPAAEAEMKRIISGEQEKPFTSDTIAQAHDFLRAVREHCSVPEQVRKGYWNTIIFGWTTGPRGPLDIEIFGDRLELYHFPDRRVDITYVPHVPGEPFPPELIAELPMLGGPE
jgi:hypothetical protein